MKCDLHRFFVPCFIADPRVSTAAGAPTFLATVLVTHPSPQQGMMGIAVLYARLQNLYDWRPFTSHVLLSLHISAVHFGLSTRSVVVVVFFVPFVLFSSPTVVDVAFKDIQDLFVFLSTEP